MARVSGSIAGGREDDLLKTGPGLLQLTGMNTYLGATLIQEGTVLVIKPGTIASSTLTDVHPAATLGGDGEVGRVRVLDGGRLAPGNHSAGTAVLTMGDFMMQGGGARFEVQLAGSTAGTAFDQLDIKGGVTLNGGSLQGSLLNGFSPQLDQLFFIVLNDGTDPVSGQFAQGGAVRFGEIDFSISYTGNSEAGSFTGGNDVVLRAIPEPSIGLMALAGALLLTRSRARRARGTPRSVIAVV
jgi:autotransporter-associated beta strand protein